MRVGGPSALHHAQKATQDFVRPWLAATSSGLRQTGQGWVQSDDRQQLAEVLRGL